VVRTPAYRGQNGELTNPKGFRLQSHLLARMFELVETGQVQLPLFDPATVPDPNISNPDFLREYCVNLLQSAFSHLQL
jgi:exportin-1